MLGPQLPLHAGKALDCDDMAFPGGNSHHGVVTTGPLHVGKGQVSEKSTEAQSISSLSNCWTLFS